MTTIVSSIIRIATWLALLSWVGLVAVYWASSSPQSVVHQCALAAQSAAMMVAGYAVARAITEIMVQVERLFLVARNHQGGTYVESPDRAGGRHDAVADR